MVTGGYGASVEYLTFDFHVGSEYSKPTLKVRNFKLHGQLYSSFYDITATCADSGSGVKLTKYALGSQTKDYFKSNGTTFTGETFRVTANGTYTVYVEDNAGNGEVSTIEVTKIDTAGPTFTSCEIKNITSTGYDVYIYGVADAGSGVSRVQFPTWTDENGQDDIQSSWPTNSAATGTKQSDGTTWVYHVNTTDHKNEAGKYYTNIYLYDYLGNRSLTCTANSGAVTIPTVTATFNSNGGSTANPATIVKAYNNDLGTLPTTSRIGYTFAGWFTAASGGTQISATTKMPSSNTTYYAHWTPNELTFANQTITKTFSTSSQTVNVTAASNGTGTYTYSKVSGESDITVSSSGEITIPAGKTANTTGYTVVIRATDSNSGATKDATYTITVGKQTVNPVTNLAVGTDGKVTWTASSNATGYEISIDGTNYTSATSGINYLSTITATTGTRTVYVRAINSDTANYTTPSSAVSKAVTVYSVALTKGTGVSAVTGAGNYINGATVTLGATVNTGYTFSKWTKTSGGAQVSTTKAYSAKISGNWAYTANATANTYTIKFNSNGGSGTMANESMTYDTVKALASNTFTRSGYTFAGWSTSASDTCVFYDNTLYSQTTVKTVDNDIKHYYVDGPHDAGEVYQVEFNAKGSGQLYCFFHTNPATANSTISAINSDGYVGTGKDGRNIINLNSDYKHYTIRYTLGTSTDPSRGKEALFRIPAGSTASFTGVRIFKCSATSSEYYDKQDVMNLTDTNGSTVNLYAIWMSNSQITGGSSTPSTESSSCPHGSTHRVTQGSCYAPCPYCGTGNYHNIETYACDYCNNTLYTLHFAYICNGCGQRVQP